MVDRRKFITSVATAGTIAVAGCSGNTSSGSQNPDSNSDSEVDDDSSLIDVEPRELLPSADLFGDGWEETDNEGGSSNPIELDGDTAKTGFVTDDGLNGIDIEVTVLDSIDKATSGYKEMRDADSSDPSVEDVDIASEGYLFDAFGSVYFRDANVIGILVHISDTGPTKPVEYAADWHETWRE